jgi:hypothetical protein
MSNLVEGNSDVERACFAYASSQQPKTLPLRHDRWKAHRDRAGRLCITFGGSFRRSVPATRGAG